MITKKIFLSIVFFLGLITMTFAQKKPVEKAKQPTTEVKKKADGTPDMRYKENKEKAKAAGPKKADGTPDMRFKENQDKAKAKTTEVKKEVKKKG